MLQDFERLLTPIAGIAITVTVKVGTRRGTETIDTRRKAIVIEAQGGAYTAMVYIIIEIGLTPIGQIAVAIGIAIATCWATCPIDTRDITIGIRTDLTAITTMIDSGAQVDFAARDWVLITVSIIRCAGTQGARP